MDEIQGINFVEGDGRVNVVKGGALGAVEAVCLSEYVSTKLSWTTVWSLSIPSAIVRQLCTLQ